MNEHDLLLRTRRQFFENCGVGVGKVALASMLASRGMAAPRAENPLAPKQPHFPPKVRNIIYLFMAGAPSQFELFEYKPKLQEMSGQPAPDSYLKGKRFAFMDTFSKNVPKLMGTSRKFARHGQSGAYISECLPYTAKVADDMTFLRTVYTENFNHAPAKFFVNTGVTRFGRPSMGAWITYGIGSESQDLPGFVVLQSGPRGPRGGTLNWGSGFLPTTYQGVPFRSVGDPILDLSSPQGVTSRRQAQTVEAIRDMNNTHLADTGDAEIATRIATYEMAYRMQTSGPELIDFNKESKETLKLYGAEAGKASFANNCLLARRMVERGVRFVQLYHTEWDHHADLSTPLDEACKEIDQPVAALLTDLKRTGLLDHTLVVWGGEFGRTPMSETREDSNKRGRNHHIDAYTMWMAGGGLKHGTSLGITDDFGFMGVEDRISVHDVQATILHLLGLEHTKLTFRSQGRDFRLTDVEGKVLHKILA